MTSVRLLIFRITMTLGFVCLMVFSIVCIKNIEAVSAKAWQENMRKQTLYQTTPNCFPHHHPLEEDQSLPPCRNVQALVLAKPQKTVSNPLRYRSYPVMDRYLKLQFADRSVQTVGTVYKNMWDSIRVGDQVSVTIWEGQVEKIGAHGDNSSITDMTGSGRGIARILPWLTVDLLCSFFLSRLWNFGRRPNESL